jgi:hypothetical protein
MFREVSESMVDEQLFATLAKLRDGFNGMAMALDELIQQESKTVMKEYDPEKIKWIDANGAKGPYQKSDDANNLEFKALRKDLADHKGFLQFKGFQYWVMQDGNTIARRKKA